MFDMMTVVSWMAWAIVLLGGARPGGSDSLVAVRPVRFFSPGSGSTVIEGTSEIPLHVLAAAGEASTTRYRVEITVADSSGLQLFESDWTRELPTDAARAPGASAMES